MKTLSWNTGRLYSKFGQRIGVAVINTTTLAFYDYDRMVSGIMDATLAGADDSAIRRYVTDAYDRFAYRWPKTDEERAAVKLAEEAAASAPGPSKREG